MYIGNLADPSLKVETDEATKQDSNLEHMISESMAPICDLCIHSFELDVVDLEYRCNRCPAHLAVSSLAYKARNYGQTTFLGGR